MRHRLWIVITALALVGCQAGGTPTPTMPVSPPPASPTPSPSPTVEFTGDRFAAYQHVRTFLDAYDTWLQDPQDDINGVIHYLADEAQIMIVDIMFGQLDDKKRLRGVPAYRKWEVSDVTEAPDGTQQTVVSFCMDMTPVISVSSDGTEKNLTLVTRESYSLRKTKTGFWEVFELDNEVTSC